MSMSTLSVSLSPLPSFFFLSISPPLPALPLPLSRSLLQVDLALGHVAAINKFGKSENPLGCVVYNLGSGKGYSVLEVIKAFEKASGKTIKYTITPRRPGDIASCYADASKALKELGWKTTFDLDKMCEDGWRWQSQNPKGYSTE
eukprot:m.125849 g.125849  ORF g.125849 m.125849 type:complete len:145 (+) comp23479_c1_seq2:101-535(+)